MNFDRDVIVEYQSNDFVFIQKFAEHAYQLQRLNKEDFDVIVANRHYKTEGSRGVPKRFTWEQI
jgi:hypothetical protein